MVETTNVKKYQTSLLSGDQQKSVDKALSDLAAPVATVLILSPSMNVVRKCTVIKDNMHQGEVSSLRDVERPRTVLTQEKKCSTPASSSIAKQKLLEKKQSETIISTPSKPADSLLSKMLRRKSQGEKL